MINCTKNLQTTTFLAVFTTLITIVFSLGAAELSVPTQYKTIEAALEAASNGDTIIVGSGTYTPANGKLVINKSITLEAEASLDEKPIIKTNCNSWTNCAIQIAADDVTLAGFEIDNSTAGKLTGYIVGDYNTKKNGWTIKYCDIHDGRNAIRPMGDNVTIEYCNLYNTSSDLINCEYGSCFGLKVKYNQLHSENTGSGGKPAGITYSCSASSGEDVEISNNYCWATRTFVDFQNSSNELAPQNRITITHNTVDYGMIKTPDYNTGQSMSIAWWTDGGNWNGPNFIITNNIFTRQRWYQVVDTDNLLKGEVLLKNNLFWLWYQDKELSANQNGWPEKQGAVGWEDMGTDNKFVIENGITKDPMFKASGSDAKTYYSLQSDSPAIGAAIDGTNIGAWQGNNNNPMVKNVSPGSTTAGNTVTITGKNFTNVQSVLFGENQAKITDKTKDNMIKVIVPEGPSGKEVDVTIVTPQGEGVLPDGFRYKEQKNTASSI